MKRLIPTSCYFTPDEKRVIAEIAEREERPQAKIVQFAVRVFQQVYTEDRAKAVQMAAQAK